MITVHPREDDGRARGADGAGDRFVGFHPLLQEPQMPADDEQGVVGSHGEPEHDPQGRGDGRDVERVSRQPDDGQAAGQGDDRGRHRQRRGDEGAEGEQQDDQGGENADDLAQSGAGAGELLAEVPAGGDLDARVAGRLGRIEDAVRLVVVEVAG